VIPRNAVASLSIIRAIPKPRSEKEKHVPMNDFIPLKHLLRTFRLFNPSVSGNQ
jgi:hypothetical protein